MNSICIRPAQPEDLETIVAFINALAHYEHLEDQVVGNPEELKEHLFGPPPLWPPSRGSGFGRDESASGGDCHLFPQLLYL